MKKLFILFLMLACNPIPEIDAELLEQYPIHDRYMDIRMAVIYSWEEVEGTISEECYEESHDIIMLEYESGLPDTSQYEIANVVWVRSPLTTPTRIKSAIQRWIEFFSNCEYDDPDISDNKQLWSGADSVARKALARVNGYWSPD